MEVREQRRFQRIRVEELGNVPSIVTPHAQTPAVVVVVPDAVVDTGDAVGIADVSQLTLIVVG